MPRIQKQPRITDTAVLAYSQCARRAYLHMFTSAVEHPPEYVTMMKWYKKEAERQSP